MPVSSSAQLVLLPELFGWTPPEHRTAFAAALHLGSTVGICWALRRELADLAGTSQGRRQAAVLLATSLPAAAAGLVVDDLVERRLGGPGSVAALLGAAGVVLWVADRRPQDLVQVGTAAAAAASLAQLFALAPGVSRAGATLTALRACRVERGAAARFSLLMSLPVSAGAALLPLCRADRPALRALGPALAAALPAAAVSGGVSAAVWRGRPASSAGAATLYRLGVAALVIARSFARGRNGRRR